MSETVSTTPSTPAGEHLPFRAGLNLLTFQMARGHAQRMGHELAGYYVPSILLDGSVTLIRTCCKTPAPTGYPFPKVTTR